MAERTFRIRLPANRGSQLVDVKTEYRRGQWAMNRRTGLVTGGSLRGWTVTHVPSGLAVVHSSAKKCRKVIDELAAAKLRIPMKRAVPLKGPALDRLAEIAKRVVGPEDWAARMEGR